MGTSFDAVDKVTPWKEAWKLRVMIVRLWYDSDAVLNTHQQLLQMVLMDDKLHKIQATVREPLIPYFIDDLEEGSHYIMTNFIVIPNIGSKRLTSHRFKLLFQLKTTVIQSLPFITLDNGFSFFRIDEILENKGATDLLIDFIGVLIGFVKGSEIESYGKRMKVIILQVFADGKKIQCNVMGKCCDEINFSVLSKLERPPVVIVRSFKIIVQEGKVRLQNVVNVSSILLNPDLPKSIDSIDRFSVAQCHFSKLNWNEIGSLIYIIDDESYDSEMIRSVGALKDNREENFKILVGTISCVFKKQRWWLSTCLCTCLMAFHSNDMYCRMCNISCIGSVPRYCLKLIIAHENGNNVFIVRDPEVTQILKKPCSDLFIEHPEFQ